MPEHVYPGLGLPLRHHEQLGVEELYPIGVHTNCWDSDSEMLLIREVAMMIVMDRLMEKPDWHVKVFDEVITEKWIEEGLALPVDPMYDDIVMASLGGARAHRPKRGPKRLKTILDRGCLEYCIKELRVKAKFFEKTCLIPTLDASASVVKSDNLIDAPLHNALRAAFTKLKDEQKDNPDWHPWTNDKVQDLVHPSLYPLVYGMTKAFHDEVVGVDDAIDKWADKGETIAEQGPDDQTSRRRWGYYQRDGEGTGIGGNKVHPSFWSNRYQWLPANVKFQDDGSVKFTSYINNLHPVRHKDVYATIEKLVERALPAWDYCLARRKRGSIKLVGGGRVEPRFPKPCSADDDNDDNWTPDRKDVQVLPRPVDPESEPESDDEPDDDDNFSDVDEEGFKYSGTRHEVAWEKIREPVQPPAPGFEAWDYGVKPGETLRERFKDLQIIAKMASIELTPEKPDFPPGGWHVEGQMNEHIVGTALYYLDSENVTSSHLHFRMQTSTYQSDFEVSQDAYHWLERVYGSILSGGPCLQGYGSVETKEGRLLAFPNVYHHRVSPFSLKDPTKPGHRRFIALWLVDPLTRIINTGNVPPQQQSWWMEHAFGNLNAENAGNVPQPIAQLLLDKVPGHEGLRVAMEKGRELPLELTELVRASFGDAMPMSMDQAKEHRVKLMEVRSSFQDEVRDKWHGVEYSFCEH